MCGILPGSDRPNDPEPGNRPEAWDDRHPEPGHRPEAWEPARHPEPGHRPQAWDVRRPEPGNRPEAWEHARHPEPEHRPEAWDSNGNVSHIERSALVTGTGATIAGRAKGTDSGPTEASQRVTVGAPATSGAPLTADTSCTQQVLIAQNITVWGPSARELLRSQVCRIFVIACPGRKVPKNMWFDSNRFG